MLLSVKAIESCTAISYAPTWLSCMTNQKPDNGRLVICQSLQTSFQLQYKWLVPEHK